MRRSIVAIMAVLAVAFVALAGTAGAQDTSSQNIVQIAQSNPDLSTLVKAVSAAGLAETLSGPGPFTVFAPTNAAFAALPAGTLDTLLKDPTGQLASVLKLHVVAGAVDSAAAKAAVGGTSRPWRPGRRHRVEWQADDRWCDHHDGRHQGVEWRHPRDRCGDHEAGHLGRGVDAGRREHRHRRTRCRGRGTTPGSCWHCSVESPPWASAPRPWRSCGTDVGPTPDHASPSPSSARSVMCVGGGCRFGVVAPGRTRRSGRPRRPDRHHVHHDDVSARAGSDVDHLAPGTAAPSGSRASTPAGSSRSPPDRRSRRRCRGRPGRSTAGRPDGDPGCERNRLVLARAATG